MEKRKLIFTAGGASIVAAALAMNVGAAAAVDGDGVCTTFCGDTFGPMQKIDSVIQKISTRFDKTSPVIDQLGSVVNKLNEVFFKLD